MTAFKRAERKSAKLRAAICGTSGSGKTYSSLLLAKGLGNRVAVIDTERGSAELYAELFDFDVAQLSPPYTPKRYIALIDEASKNYDVLVIDSLSHAWAGEGGVLAMHDNAARADRSGNSYTAWRNITPEHNALVEAILSAPCHVICAMRSKTAYEMTDDGKGKKKPIKIGLAPIQRDGMEYEFAIVLDVSVDGHVATASKDRTNLWDGRNEVITQAHGEELRQWLESGKQVEQVESGKITADDFRDAISKIRDKNELRPWILKEAEQRSWKITDSIYIDVKAICAKRADEIDAAAAKAATKARDLADFEEGLGPVEEI